MNVNLTLDDAQKFTQLFRQTLPAGDYEKFCKSLDGFLKLEIDLKEFVIKTMELINGNETLAQEFLKFLPMKSESPTTTTASAGEKPPAAARKKKKTDKSKSVLENYVLQKKGNRRAKRIWESTDNEEKKAACVKFLYKVLDKAEDSDTFLDFLDLTIGYEMHKDADRVNREACELFKNQPELLYEFSSFVADAFNERDRKREKEKGIAMANQTLSKELCLSEFTLKWMEVGKEKLRAKSEDFPAKKKQKTEMMPQKLHPSEFCVENIVAGEAEAVEELTSYLSEIPRTEEEEEVSIKKRKRGSSDETVSSEERDQVYDECANTSSDGEELDCEETVVGTELSLAVPASRLELPEFVSTDLVLSAPACRVGAC